MFCRRLIRTKVIMFGSAGCLDKDITRGKIIILTEAYHDEGISYHYAPATDYITLKNSHIVADFMKQAKIPYVLRKTWTTDAIYSETRGNFENYKGLEGTQGERIYPYAVRVSTLYGVSDTSRYKIYTKNLYFKSFLRGFINEQYYKPSSVLDDHLSSSNVAIRLKRPTRRHSGQLYSLTFGLASGGVYICLFCYQKSGELLPRLSTLTNRKLFAVYFCCTCLRVASTRRYLAPCPMKLGLSSPITFRSEKV